jgi:hypothetical protein
MCSVLTHIAEASPRDYGVKWGDTLSQISETECGRASLYPAIAETNGIKGPEYRIYAGETLEVSCEKPGTVTEVAIETPSEVATEEPYYPITFLPEITASAPVVEEVTAEHTETEETVVYEIVVDLGVVKPGKHPALLVETSENGEEQTSEMEVRAKDKHGKTYLTIPIKSGMNSLSSVVFDHGGRSRIRLGYSDLSGRRVGRVGPGFWRRTFSFTRKYVLPGAIAYSLSGPVWAVVPLAQTIVSDRVEKNNNLRAAMMRRVQ